MSSKTPDEAPATTTPLDIDGAEKDNITDDDGIANFLSDAIGQDVDVDVFKDIGDSDTIAEIMEVVTASFVGTNSRRNSNQEEKILPESREVSRSLVSPTRPIRRPGKKFPPLQPEEKKVENRTKNKAIDKKKMSEKDGPGASDKIKNRLKVRLKFSPHQQHNIDVSSKSKTSKNSNTTKPTATSKHNPVPKTTKDNKNISTPNVILKKRQNNENILLHKKCTNGKHSRIVGSKPCCVIVYDILKTDKFFEMVTPTTQQKSSSTSINLCSITEDKIEEFHAIETKNRLYYHDLFNSSTNTATVLSKVGEKKKCVFEPQKINLKESGDKKNSNTHKSRKDTIDKIKTPSSKKASVDIVTSDNSAINLKSRETREDIVATPNAQHEEYKTCDLQTNQASSASAFQNESFNTKDEDLVKSKPLVNEITPSSSKVVKDEARIMKSKTKDVQDNDEEKTSRKPLVIPSPNCKETLTKSDNSTATITSTDVDLEKQKINVLKQPTSTPDAYVEDADDQQRRRRRQREKDETKREKDKKFERLENERQRKSSDTKKATVTDRETTTSKLLQTCYTPTKGLSMSQSFRIPKAQGDYPKIPKLQQISTPLPKLDEHEIPKPKVDHTKEEDKKQISATPCAIIKYEYDHSAADRRKSQVDGGHDESPAPVRSSTIDESESILPKLQCINDEDNKQASTSSVSTKHKHDQLSENPKSQVDDATNRRTNHEKQPLALTNCDKVNRPQLSPNRQVQPEFNCPSPAIQNDVDEAVNESHTNTTIPDPDDAADDSSVPNDCGATLPPLSEIVEIGNFAKAVTVLIQKNFDISEPTYNNFTSTTDAITGKCAWWFSKCDKEPPNLEDIKLPRLDSVNSSYGSDAGSDASFLGNVSDSDRRDDNCQVHEISSTSHKLIRGSSSTVDPDKVDEFCGRSLLQAKIRTSSGQNFRNIFDLRSTQTYEKENFQAKCNLCNQLIVGKRNLASHVRGATHKENLRKLDLHMEKAEKTEDNSVIQTSKTMSVTKPEEKKTKESKPSSKKDSSKEEKEIRLSNERVKVKIEPSGMKMQYGTTSTGLSVKIPVDDDVSTVKRSRSPLELISRSKKSRSRSPRRRRTRSRSRSPVSRIPRSPTALRLSRRSPEHYSRSRRHSRRSRSRSRSPRSSRRRRTDSDEYRSHKKSPPRRSRRRSKSRSPPLPKKDNREFHAKLALTADGKWTDEMEKQWKLMEAEEAMFREQFIDRRKEYVSAPEEHPRYANEWTEFWERRYQEVEKEGKDPDTYNYVLEWKDYWSKRLNFLLQEEADEKIREIKRKFKMDFESLNLLRKTIHQSTPVPVNANKIPENPERVYFERNKADQILNGSLSAAVDPAIMIMLSSNSSKGNGSIINISDEGMSSISSGNVILNEQNKVPEAAKRSISVEDFKSTWEAYTRPKSDGSYLRNPLGTNTTDGLRQGQHDSVFIPEFSVKTPFSQPTASIAPSDDTTTTSSDGSLDSLGFDLVQVLRLMCKTEDQLSFLAPKVLEYFKIAEELELKKSKGSHALLGNEELVTILFQARDRFMTMIRSNVLGREILQKLNLTVYGLNSILEIPQCQKFRPVPVPVATSLSPETFTTPAISKTKTVPKPNSPAAVEPVKSDSPKVTAMSAAGIEVATLAAHLSPMVKSFLAGEISKYLLLVGGQSMSGPELAEFILKLISPLIKKSSKPVMENKTDSSSSEKQPERREIDPFDINISHNSEATILGHDYTHSFDMRITGVSGSKAVGCALPTLPNMFYRSANVESQEEPTIDVRNRRNVTPATTHDQPPSKSQTREDDGRQSPFSRRELSMNPDRDVVRY